MSIAAGTRLGRYEIRSLLGAGGMGEVYLAYDSTLNRAVALKLLPAGVSHQAHLMRRFVQEARTASTLNHPNIITIHEINSEADTTFIATEFINGVTLRERIKAQDMSLDEVLDVSLQVSAALAAAHEAGIVHRDIKPENIMLRKDGYVKVLDFGLAKLSERVLREADDLRRQQEQSEIEPRFTMLETIRDYGSEQRLASDEAVALERGHALCFLALAEKVEPLLTGPEQVSWFERLAREHDNLRAALRWAKETNDAETGLRLAGALWRFWEVRGHLSEGRRWLEMLLSIGDAAPAPVRAKALSRAGALERDQGDYVQAFKLLEQALELYEQLSDRWGIAQTLNAIGYAEHEQGNYERATRYYERSLALFRELGDGRASAYLLNNLGNVAKEQADYAQAATIHEQALALFRESGDKRALAASLNNLAEVASYQGDYERATALQHESVAIKREVGDKRGIMISLNNLGDLARFQGDYQAAAELYEECLALSHEAGDKRGTAICLEALAAAACTRNDCERAARLYGAAARLRELIGTPLPLSERADYDRQTTNARAALGSELFDARSAEGAAMTLAAAIAYASSDSATMRTMDDKIKTLRDER